MTGRCVNIVIIYGLDLVKQGVKDVLLYIFGQL